MPLIHMPMNEMLKYLLIAIVVGGAVPIILSYLTKKPPKRKDGDEESNH